MPFYLARPAHVAAGEHYGGLGLLAFTTRDAAAAQLTGDAVVEGWTVVEAITAREAIEQVSGMKLPANLDVPEPPVQQEPPDASTA